MILKKGSAGFAVFFGGMAAAALLRAQEPQPVHPPGSAEVTLVIHGGAGALREEMTPDERNAYLDDLAAALRQGQAVLQRGGSSLDAVETAIRFLEDSPRFNAGKGAVFTSAERIELDASIMEGKSLRGGAVSGVERIKNPITAARAVMEQSPHVLLVGRGAEAFAERVGLELVDPSYFRTEKRLQELRRAQAKQRQAALDRDATPPPVGTVGAVALDRFGNLAAGTSTGGMNNKPPGRVGDSPILGAGTYADNAACAVSATGHGEFFIRYAVAHDIAARVKYKRQSVQQAADEVIQQVLKQAGGEGGVIVLDPQGQIALSYNTEGMYRGFITGSGRPHVAIFGEKLEPR
jgi:beta-aspartyl-peptidase (threonine type)